MRETCEKSALPVSDISLFLRRQVHSADFLRTLDLLVEQVRRYVPNVVSLLDSTTMPGETLKYLASASPDLELALNSYMDEFGDRMVTGFDLTDHTWRELPGALLAVLRSRINASSPQSSRRTMEDGAEILRQYVLPEHRNAFENGLKEAALAYGLHDEDVRITHLWPLGLLRRALLAAAAMLISRGTMLKAGHVFQTTPAELDALIEGKPSPSAAEMAERAVEWEAWDQMDSPLTLGEREDETSSHFKPLHLNRIDQATNFYLNLMESRHGANPRPEWILVDGIAASPGRYEGPARVIREPADFSKLKQGDVLVSRITSPAYNLVMPIIGAVVTDRGGALCHSAIVAREFGIPAVVGTEQATVLIPDGARVLVDGDRGFVAVRS